MTTMRGVGFVVRCDFTPLRAGKDSPEQMLKGDLIVFDTCMYLREVYQVVRPGSWNNGAGPPFAIVSERAFFTDRDLYENCELITYDVPGQVWPKKWESPVRRPETPSV